MKKTTKTIDVWIASDGKEFLKEEDCHSYEDWLQDVRTNMKFYWSYMKPDLTEGRGFQEKVAFVVYDKGMTHEGVVLTWLINNAGDPVQFVQGVAPIKGWTLPKSISFEDWQDMKDKKIKTVFLSPESIEGFPEPEWPLN